jgi:predicted NBD/HSP70 family sugar kinase
MKIGDLQLVKRINRSVLLRLLRSHPGASRAQLSQLSGLTKSTVSSAVRELIDDGWLEEATLDECRENPPAQRQGQGRPSTPLMISSKHHALVGIDLAVDGLRLAVVSLTGQLLWSAEHLFGLDQKTLEPKQVLSQAAHLVSEVRDQLRLRGLQLSGTGLGLPGAMDVKNGMLRVAPNLGWRNEPIGMFWSAALSKYGLEEMPTSIQNEADCAALGEYEFSPHASTDALIFVTCDVGVGAGIVLNDQIYAGAQGLAGEIGHNILVPSGELCSCGRHGCAETLIGARALEYEFKTTGDVAGAGRALGVLLQNLWTAFNPGQFVMGGKSFMRYPVLLTHAKATLVAYADAAGISPPEIRLARYGFFTSAVGAAALVLHHQLRPVHTDLPWAAPSSQDWRLETMAA